MKKLKLYLNLFNQFITNKLVFISIILLFYLFKMVDLCIYHEEMYKIYIAIGEAIFMSITSYFFYKNNKTGRAIFMVSVGLNGLIFFVWGFLRIIFKYDWKGLMPGILGFYFIYTIISIILNERKSVTVPR